MICKLSVIVAQAFIVITAYRIADGEKLHRSKDVSSSGSSSNISRVIEREVGSDIQMNCTIKPEHLSFNLNSIVDWYFQPCTSIFCDSSYNYLEISNDTEWIKLNHSKPTLYIQNLDVERDSGLYRCSVEPYKIANVTLNIQFVMNHHLVVIDNKQNTPLILDKTPADIVTVTGATAIFHCRVRSRGFPPAIKWYKRHENSHHPNNEKNIRSITYHNITYDLIREGDQKRLADDLYLSKLILPGVKIQDGGTYGCIALSYGGYDKQEALLKVNPPMGDPVKLSNHSGEIRNFFWLFFFPIFLFIIIPLIIWMWFHSYKKECKRDTRKKNIETNILGSNRWIARPENTKNPYLVVNLEIV